MDNNRRFEIENKIISVEQIRGVSDYLQKTCNYYAELIKQDLQRNNNVYFSNASYKYYACSLPKVKYRILYLDGREINTEDEYVFKDALNEPQFLKEINQQLFISYKDNDMDEETEHTMSIYLTFTEKFIFFSTSDKNMDEPSYNMNSYVRGILESGEDRFSGIVKNKFWIKNIIGLAVGSILTLILLDILRN